MVGEQKATTKTTVTRKFLDPVKVKADLGKGGPYALPEVFSVAASRAMTGLLLLSDSLLIFGAPVDVPDCG